MCFFSDVKMHLFFYANFTNVMSLILKEKIIFEEFNKFLNISELQSACKC